MFFIWLDCSIIYSVTKHLFFLSNDLLLYCKVENITSNPNTNNGDNGSGNNTGGVVRTNNMTIDTNVVNSSGMRINVESEKCAIKTTDNVNLVAVSPNVMSSNDSHHSNGKSVAMQTLIGDKNVGITLRTK